MGDGPSGCPTIGRDQGSHWKIVARLSVNNELLADSKPIFCRLQRKSKSKRLWLSSDYLALLRFQLRDFYAPSSRVLSAIAIWPFGPEIFGWVDPFPQFWNSRT